MRTRWPRIGIAAATRKNATAAPNASAASAPKVSRAPLDAATGQGYRLVAGECVLRRPRTSGTPAPMTRRRHLRGGHGRTELRLARGSGDLCGELFRPSRVIRAAPVDGGLP